MRKSILDDVGEIINRELGLTDDQSLGKTPHYRHRKSFQRLSTSPAASFNGASLVGAIYDKVESNLTSRKPSDKNWRLTVNPAKKDESKAKNRKNKLEVRLERRIIKLSKDWFNQVPTASGLVSEYSDKRGSIDLVHKCGDGSYEFIELKLASNNPLFSAMEILQYGILYILARKIKRIRDACKEKKILRARTIHLKVLAPEKYYRGCGLVWLENELNLGLSAFLIAREPHLKMAFRFEKFPPGFKVSKDAFPEDSDIKKALKARRPVYS